MQSATYRDVQPEDREDSYSSVVSDLRSLIEHMQASMNMLEGAIARELPLGSQDAGDNVIVLDDITPCFVKANAALHACKAGLGVALDFLAGTEPPIARVVEFPRSDRRLAEA
jgi:hypothetical protein